MSGWEVWFTTVGGVGQVQRIKFPVCSYHGTWNLLASSAWNPMNFKLKLVEIIILQADGRDHRRSSAVLQWSTLFSIVVGRQREASCSFRSGWGQTCVFLFPPPECWSPAAVSPFKNRACLAHKHWFGKTHNSSFCFLVYRLLFDAEDSITRI